MFIEENEELTCVHASVLTRISHSASRFPPLFVRNCLFWELLFIIIIIIKSIFCHSSTQKFKKIPRCSFLLRCLFRLTILYTTVLFVAREPFRKACLSVPKEDINHITWPLLANLIWITVPAGAALAALMGYIWCYSLEQPNDPRYMEAVWVYAASAVLELLVEPLWMLGQIFLFIRLKVVAEGAALGARCAVTIVLLLTFPEMGLRIFSVAQIAHSAVLLAVYYGTFARSLGSDKELPLKSIRDIFPRMHVEGRPGVFCTWDGLGALSWSFMQQSLMKQFLTKGEGYIMTFFNVMTFSEQGVYNVVDNLGSLPVTTPPQPLRFSLTREH